MTNPLIYFYTDGACGTGKTFQAIDKIAMSGGKHIFVVDQKKMMPERQRMLGDALIDLGNNMKTAMITSDDNRNSKDWSVRNRVHGLGREYEDDDDVCVFITHEAMRMCDFSDFQGWNIWIDEVPDIMDNQSINICVSKMIFKQLYNLEPIMKDEKPSGWSTVTLRDTTIDLASIASDDLINGLRSLHRRVLDNHKTGRRAVIVNGNTWDDFDKNNKSTWFSIWSPEGLSSMLSVNFLGNAFTDSLTFQIMKSMWPNIQWKEVTSNNVREFKDRQVNIHFFAENHNSSRTLFGSEEGKSILGRISRHINSLTKGREHIWMCNKAEDDVLPLVGTKLSPKQAGTNDFKSVTAATAIYSVKPDAEQRKVYEMLGVDPEYYTETNERENILQFMCRTSIRDPENESTVDLFVYDKTQAMYLKRYFDRDTRGYAKPNMILHDLGFAKMERKPGRPTVEVTEEEIAARKAKKNEAAKLRMAAKRAAAKKDK